jgi:hypothetical protein
VRCQIAGIVHDQSVLRLAVRVFLAKVEGAESFEVHGILLKRPVSSLRWVPGHPGGIPTSNGEISYLAQDRPGTSQNRDRSIG